MERLFVKLFTGFLLISWASASNHVPKIEVCHPKPCNCDKGTEIDCDNKELGTVAITPLVESDRVTVLSMRANKITEIKRQQIMMGKTARLTRLTLSNNMINQIEDNAFESAPSLDYLDLKNNMITALTVRTFAGLPNLLDLHLDHNKIVNLTNSVFAVTPKLRYLSIDWTPLKQVSNETFRNLGSLVELSIDHAELSFLPPDTMKYLSRLETLSLRHNRFLVVPDELHWLTQLRRLDLSGNPIVTITSNAFRHNSHLHNLAFHNMPNLSYVEDCAFCSLHELRTLEIVNCTSFNDFDPEAFGRDKMYFKNIETIDLANNSLTILEDDMLAWVNISVIRLGNNPWVCDCNAIWMINPALKYDKAEVPVCDSPVGLKGKKITELGNYEFGLCITARLTGRIRAARMFLIVAMLIIVCGIIPRPGTSSSIDAARA